MTAPDSPWLHVIVPAYGENPHLRTALLSVARHLPDDVPVTVLDDASPTDVVARTVAEVGGHLEYVRNARNLGIAGTFNEALRISRGEYTVLMGHDDVMLPRAADAYRDGLTGATRPALVQPQVLVIDEHDQLVHPLGDRIKAWLHPRKTVVSGAALGRSLALGNWMYFPAIAWRTGTARAHGFAENTHTAMDLDLLLRLVLDGEQFVLTERFAMAYRRHARSASSLTAGRERLTEELQVLAAFADRAGKRGWHSTAAAARLAPTCRLHGALADLRS